MDDAADERRYAWRMIRAARRAHADGAARPSRADVAALLDQALDAGLDRAELIVALAELGGRLLGLCEPFPDGSTGSGETSGTARSTGDVCLT